MPFISAQQSVMRIVFKYDAFFTLTEATAGAGAIYSFRLNSLFDPDLTSTGKQPLGFDQYAAIFSRYRVVKVSFDVTYMGNDFTTPRPQRVGFMVTPSSTVPSDPEAWPAQLFSKSAVMASPNLKPPRLASSISLPQIFGIKKSEFHDNDYASITGANPTRIAYLHVFNSGLSGSSGAGAIAIAVVNIRFHTEMFDRVPLGLS